MDNLFLVRCYERLYLNFCFYCVWNVIMKVLMSKDEKLFFLGTLFTIWKYTYTSWLFYKPATKKEISIHPTSPNPSWEVTIICTAKFSLWWWSTCLNQNLKACFSKRFSSILPTVTKRLVLQMGHAKSIKR